MRIVGLVLVTLVAGCASSYSVKLDGDVLGSQKDTPRDARAGVYTGGEAAPLLATAAGTLRPLDDATILVRAVHDQTWKPQSKITDLATLRAAPSTGHFHLETGGETRDGPVEALQLYVTSPGREPVLHQIAVERGGPIEVHVVVVLDQANGAGTASPSPPPTR